MNIFQETYSEKKHTLKKGVKAYHLGNVLAVVSDKKIAQDDGVGIVSIAFWDVGAVYYGGKLFFTTTLTNTQYMIDNGINPGMQFIINKE